MPVPCLKLTEAPPCFNLLCLDSTPRPQASGLVCYHSTPDIHPCILDTLNTCSFQNQPCSVWPLCLCRCFSLGLDCLSCHSPSAHPLSGILLCILQDSFQTSADQGAFSAPHQLEPPSPLLLLPFIEHLQCARHCFSLSWQPAYQGLCSLHSQHRVRLHRGDGTGLGGHRKPSFSDLKA